MDILNSIVNYIDWPYLLVFMFLTYFLIGYVFNLLKSIFGEKVRKRLVVFIIGTLTALPFIFYFKHDPINLLVTWSAGLALHDYFVVLIIDKFKSFTKNKSNEQL